MNRIEFLDSLFDLRRQVLRMTIATASQQVSEATLQQLLAERDQLSVIIQHVIGDDLAATMTDIGTACAALGTATKQLKELSGSEAEVLKGIDITRKVIDGLTPVIAHVV